jgi:hypothetical protein
MQNHHFRADQALPMGIVKSFSLFLVHGRRQLSPLEETTTYTHHSPTNHQAKITHGTTHTSAEALPSMTAA